MNRLVKDLFGSEFTPRSRLFGLCCGQRRSDPLISDAGWYNADGQRLGWGSLTALDLRKIAAGLTDDEIFIVLSGFDSFWGIAYGHGELNSDYRLAGAHMAEPGRDHVETKCCFIIIRHRVFHVDRESWTISENESVPAIFLGGLLCESLTRIQAQQLIAGCRASVRIENVTDEMIIDEPGQDDYGPEFISDEDVVVVDPETISLPEWSWDR